MEPLRTARREWSSRNQCMKKLNTKKKPNFKITLLNTLIVENSTHTKNANVASKMRMEYILTQTK